MNAMVDHAVMALQLFGLMAMGYGMALSIMRKKHEMPSQAAKIFARY